MWVPQMDGKEDPIKTWMIIRGTLDGKPHVLRCFESQPLPMRRQGIPGMKAFERWPWI